jgi:protein-disulfide isomerase
MGLRAADFKACLSSNRHEAAINASTEEGQRVGVTGTPTFFVNGRRMVGARSEQHFDEIIQAELQ